MPFIRSRVLSTIGIRTLFAIGTTSLVSSPSVQNMYSTSENNLVLKQFLAFISTLKAVKGDLSNITAPPYLLAQRSAVEIPASWCERPSLFVAPASQSDPEKRALLVLKWYLSALKSQQYASGDDAGSVKKPLNPFLGELFIAEWNDEMGKTRLISEQVSHHPPVTACYMWNDKHGVRVSNAHSEVAEESKKAYAVTSVRISGIKLTHISSVQAQGYTRQEMSFNGSVHITQVGHAVLHLDAYNEDHVQTIPSITIKSLLSRSPYPELNGPVHIYSSSGYTSKIEFSGTTMMGWGGNKKNTVRATIYKNGDEKNPLYAVEGQWSDELVFKDLRTKKDMETYNIHNSDIIPSKIAPLDQQDPWESRRAWRGVVKALQAGDMRGTSEAKSIIERAQREMRKQEQAEGREWEAKFFSRADSDPVFEKLAAPHGELLHTEMTNGIWRFDEEKFRKARMPFRGDLTPSGPKHA